MSEKFICPVCGYDTLEEAPFQRIENGKRIYSYKEGGATFEICPCCGVEFGLTDYEKSWNQLREEWIKSGYKWHSSFTKKPENFNPKKQLENLKKISFN